MQRSRLSFTLGALLLALVCIGTIIALAPATWLGPLLAAQSGDKLVISDATGTLWSGTGRVALGSSRWSAPVHWTLSPWTLLRGRVEIAVALADSAPPAHLSVDGDGVTLAATTLTLPAAALAGAFGIPMPLALGGDVTLTTPGAAWHAKGAEGAFTLQWLGARLGDSGGRGLDLGSLSATLAAHGDGFGGTLSNNGGDAAIAGTLALAATASSIDLTITPRSPNPPPLLQMVKLLGSPVDGGGTRVQWQNRRR
jgi:hypothetical protein